MTASTERLIWSDAGTFVAGAAPADQPLVIDSWLAAHGQVRGLELHERRFQCACSVMLPELDTGSARGFLAATRAAVPCTDRWFPRVEAYAGRPPLLALWLRPAPPAALEARLWVPPVSDPRQLASIKGPDLLRLAALRDDSRRTGCDDALLYCRDGIVLEAAHAALVWWRGSTLCLPDARLPTLPSVTLTLLQEIAESQGVSVRREQCRVNDLLELETWALNALHGIRPVSEWWRLGERIGEPPISSPVEDWQRALARLMSAVRTSGEQRLSRLSAG